MYKKKDIGKMNRDIVRCYILKSVVVIDFYYFVFVWLFDIENWFKIEFIKMEGKVNYL